MPQANLEIAVVDLALRVVSLDREGAVGYPATREVRGGRPVFRLGKINDDLAVHARDDALALDADGHREPLVILGHGLEVGLDAPEPGGATRVAVGVVYLHLVTLGRPSDGLELGVKVDAGVRLRLCPHVYRQLEILEVMVRHRTGVEQVAARALHHDLAVGDREHLGFFRSLPAVERFAVKQQVPARGQFGQSQCVRLGGPQGREQAAARDEGEEFGFHGLKIQMRPACLSTSGGGPSKVASGMLPT